MRGDAGTEGSQGQERELLPGRRDRALAPAVVETCATGTSARKARRIAERMGVGRLSKDQAGAIARSLDADAAEPLGRDLSGYRISNPKSFGAQTGVVPLFRTVLARLQGLGFACMPRGSSSPASA